MKQKLPAISWCLYDWANSAFATVILTFVFSVYFGRGIVGDETEGAVLWGYAVAASGFLIAISAPFLGAAADAAGRYKKPLTMMILLCVMVTALLWFAVPGDDTRVILLVLGLLVFANTTFELSMVFYNAMIKQVVVPERIGRLSGMAWGLGYLGGLSCLVLVLFGLIGLGETKPLLSLPQENSEHVRASALLVALWMLVFSLPLLLFVKDGAGKGVSVSAALQKGARDIKEMLLALKQHLNLAKFLLASAVYRDGLNTLFAVGGLYAAGVYGMAFDEILIFAIGLNVTAGLGAFAFSFIDDRIGSKRVILIALTALVVIGAATLLVDDKTTFMILALGLGIFIGPAQAAGRALAARLTPTEMSGRTFGLYAFTGKSIAFLGPFLFALATDVFDNQRAGMGVILLFWLIGGIILTSVKENRA